MTDVVTLDERKGTAKREPCMLLSVIPKEMPLSGKELGEIVKIYYMNGQNATQTLWQNSWITARTMHFKTVWDLFINSKKLVAHAIDLGIDELLLWKLLQKFIRK